MAPKTLFALCWVTVDGPYGELLWQRTNLTYQHSRVLIDFDL